MDHTTEATMKIITNSHNQFHKNAMPWLLQAKYPKIKILSGSYPRSKVFFNSFRSCRRLRLILTFLSLLLLYKVILPLFLVCFQFACLFCQTCRISPIPILSSLIPSSHIPIALFLVKLSRYQDTMVPWLLHAFGDITIPSMARVSETTFGSNKLILWAEGTQWRLCTQYSGCGLI